MPVDATPRQPLPRQPISRLLPLRRAGIGMAIAVALALPAARFYFGVETQQTRLAAEADQLADTVGLRVVSNPDGWAYESNLLQSQLSQLAKRHDALALRVVDAQGVERARVGDWTRASPLRAEAPLFDSGVAVGRVELQTPIQQLLLGVLALAAVGLLLGLGVWALVRHSLNTLAQSLAHSEAARAEAEAANRSKSAFLATMSHEIRTPMNGVMGMAELLAHSRLDESQGQTVATIRDSAQQLLRVIDDVLDFSKIEAGRMDLEQQPLELTVLLENLFDSLAPVAAARHVRMHLYVAAEVPERVLTDGTRLRQVLTNLLGNAIKFSGGPESQGRGSVALRVTRQLDGPLSFAVTDNGIGITAQAQAQLFQPFKQAEDSTTRRFGGTGLGLAITRRLVELMQGQIEVQSRLGDGACFRVSLPLQAADPQPERYLPSLEGVCCALVQSPLWPSEDLRAWLIEAGAEVVQVDALAALPARCGDRVSPVVVVQAHALAAVQLHTAELLDARYVLLRAEGRRVQPRLSSPESVQLDRLRRAPLLRAVAMMVGRASPPAPVAIAAQPLLPSHESEVPSLSEAQATGRLILVAEDDATNRAVIARQLQWLGHAAEMAKDGREALALWRQGRHALLITDLHMPEMDGYQLARQIRDDERLHRRARSPILLLTANALKGEEQKAREAGLDDYLTKPIPIRQLQSALQRWLPALALPLPPSSASVPENAVFDVQQLRALVGADAEFETELLTDFLRESERLSAQLEQALRAGERALVQGLAHRGKSASRSVGALRLGDAFAALEQLAAQGQTLPGASWCAEHIEPTRAAVAAHLEI